MAKIDDDLIKWIEEEHKLNCEDARMRLKIKLNSIYGLNRKEKKNGN
jgi:hypothetical protein